MTSNWIGQSLARREDDRLLRGNGRYLADLRVDGEAHVVFVRSPYAHALIRGIDTSAARAAPGVFAVLTSDDVPKGPLPPFLWDTPPEKLVAALQPELRPCHPPLLADRALYVGHAVAMVVAESRYAAEDAAELVLVDYEPLEPVASLDQSLAPDAPVVHDGWEDNVAVRFAVEKGDADAAIRDAAVVVRERFEIQRQAPQPLETRGALAVHDAETGELTLWSSTQNAHPLRRAVSRVCGLPIESVRVIAPDVGGGFGGKGVLYPEDLLVALGAIQLGRPLKWVEDRLEHMQSAIHGREQVHDIELAFDEDGRILALRDHILVDTGAYNPLGLVIPYNTIAHLMGPYRVESFEAHAEGVITTKVPTAPYRGAGRPEAVFAVERALDLGARRLGIDPLELRLRNLVTPGEMAYDTGILYRDGVPLVLDDGDYPELARRAAALVDWDRVDREDGLGRPVGRGLALYVEGTGIGPYEGARVELRPDGRVEVRTGACSQGQGHQTVFAQVCADALGVHPDLVDVIGGDTAGLEKGWGTVASRSAVVAGNAVAAAASRVRARLEAGEAAPLVETTYFEPPTVTWSVGAHAAVVAVDEETGEVEILRYAAVHDCGREINPMIVEGQVRGGIAQGIGAALLEEMRYDESGQLLSGTFADYLMPTANEMPPVAIESHETPSPLNPLGLRGVGEGGAIAPPAVIANAVEDAIAEHGAVVRRTPLTPERVRTLVGLHRQAIPEIVRR